MAPQHRLYTPEIAETILERLSDGETLKGICRTPGMPSSSAVNWWVVTDHDGFAARYARARDVGLALMADELMEIADDGANDTYKAADGSERTDHDVVQRSKLRVDTRKWLLSKLVPKVYGDRLELAGEIGIKDVPDDGIEARLVILLRAAGIAGPVGGEGAPDEAAPDTHFLPGPRTPEA